MVDVGLGPVGGGPLAGAGVVVLVLLGDGPASGKEPRARRRAGAGAAGAQGAACAHTGSVHGPVLEGMYQLC